MMVSSVLAQAILEQRSPDLVGEFEKGREITRGRQTRELTGEALRSGGGEALDELRDVNPEVALNVGETIRARNAKDINDFIRDARIGLAKIESGDIQGALQFASQRRNAVARRGGDTTQTDQIISLLNSNRVDEARDQLAALTGAIDQTKTTPASIVEREALIQDLQSDDPRVRRSAEIALKLEAPATSRLSPEEQVDLARSKALARADVELETAGEIERRKAESKEAGKGISKRQQGFIDSGIDAADATSNIRRSLDLLKTVKTGGIAAASFRAKQLFGIEGADEGELSANLGTAVLAQLKPIFGAAFTAAEGERLERISARFGTSPQTNRRLLNQALKISERAARRGIKAAKAAGDDFTAQEIQKAIDFVTGDEPISTQKDEQTQSPQARQVLNFDAQGNLVQ
jgi:hypothetical protein